MSSDGKKMAVINYSGHWRDPSMMWTSFDSGTSWKAVSSIQSLALVSSGNGSRLFLHGDTLQPPAMSTDWGATWRPVSVISYVVWCAATSYDGSKWFASGSSYGYGILCSTDFFVTSGLSDAPAIQPQSIACSSDAAIVYVAESNGSIFVWEQSSARLNMNIETNGAILSWPSYHLSSRLQQNSDLRPDGWVDLSEEPTLTNRIFQYIPHFSGDKAFYRLKTP